jgi:hypothetical protein
MSRLSYENRLNLYEGLLLLQVFGYLYQHAAEAARQYGITMPSVYVVALIPRNGQASARRRVFRNASIVYGFWMKSAGP